MTYFEGKKVRGGDQAEWSRCSQERLVMLLSSYRRRQVAARVKAQGERELTWTDLLLLPVRGDLFCRVQKRPWVGATDGSLSLGRLDRRRRSTASIFAFLLLEMSAACVTHFYHHQTDPRRAYLCARPATLFYSLLGDRRLYYILQNVGLQAPDIFCVPSARAASAATRYEYSAGEINCERRAGARERRDKKLGHVRRAFTAARACSALQTH